MDDIKLLGIFKERNFGLTGIISVLILTLIIGLLAFKTRNDQWNVWKLNKDITFYNNIAGYGNTFATQPTKMIPQTPSGSAQIHTDVNVKPIHTASASASSGNKDLLLTKYTIAMNLYVILADEYDQQITNDQRSSTFLSLTDPLHQSCPLRAGGLPLLFLGP